MPSQKFDAIVVAICILTVLVALIASLTAVMMAGNFKRCSGLRVSAIRVHFCHSWCLVQMAAKGRTSRSFCDARPSRSGYR